MQRYLSRMRNLFLKLLFLLPIAMFVSSVLVATSAPVSAENCTTKISNKTLGPQAARQTTDATNLWLQWLNRSYQFSCVTTANDGLRCTHGTEVYETRDKWCAYGMCGVSHYDAWGYRNASSWQVMSTGEAWTFSFDGGSPTGYVKALYQADLNNLGQFITSYVTCLQ